MNNLNDISLDPRAADLLGYSGEEIEHYFNNELHELAKFEEVSFERVMERMKVWYNGYRFSKKPLYVHNPLSVLYCLLKKEFSNYWFETGAPAFLIGLLKRHRDELEDIKEKELNVTALGSFEIGEEPLIPILFQF